MPEPVFSAHIITRDLFDGGIVLSSAFLQQVKGDKQKELIIALTHLNLEELIFQDAEDAELIVLDSHFADQVWLVKVYRDERPYFIIMLSSEI